MFKTLFRISLRTANSVKLLTVSRLGLASKKKKKKSSLYNAKGKAMNWLVPYSCQKKGHLAGFVITNTAHYRGKKKKPSYSIILVANI